MKQSKKLILAVIVIIVIIAVSIYAVLKVYRNNGLKSIDTNLLQIQAKAMNIKDKSIVESNENLLLGEPINEDLIEKLDVEDAEETRILSNEDLNMLGLSNIDDDQKYVVDYKTGEVYYVDGYKTKDGKIYYKLSEISELVKDD